MASVRTARGLRLHRVTKELVMEGNIALPVFLA